MSLAADVRQTQRLRRVIALDKDENQIDTIKSRWSCRRGNPVAQDRVVVFGDDHARSPIAAMLVPGVVEGDVVSGDGEPRADQPTHAPAPTTTIRIILTPKVRLRPDIRPGVAHNPSSATHSSA